MDDLVEEYTVLYQAAEPMVEPLLGMVGGGHDISDEIPEEDEIREALGPMQRGKAPGSSTIMVDNLKDWARDYEEATELNHMDQTILEGTHTAVMHWSLLVVMIQDIFMMG